jgi:hypothetical protein
MAHVPVGSFYFGELGGLPVDGHIRAQPLYVHNVQILGQGIFDVVYAVTDNCTVYAIDASGLKVLWQRSLAGKNEKPVSISTPVIDRPINVMYVVAQIQAGSTIEYHLYALDIVTGHTQLGPVVIQGSVPGTGDVDNRPDGVVKQTNSTGLVPFRASSHLNRPGLLLQQGRLYIAFGAKFEGLNGRPYHGWVFAYNADTLAPLAVFCTSPNYDAPADPNDKQSNVSYVPDPNDSTKMIAVDFRGQGAGVWQSGQGLAGDDNGAVYFTTGNGPFNAQIADYGDSVLKLSADLNLLDYFTPYNQQDLNVRDTDLGSGGVMLLPPQPGTPSDLLVTCGKEGKVYLIDRKTGNMGQYQMGPAGGDAQLVKTVLLPDAVKPARPSGVWGGPAYYNGPNGQLIYYSGRSGRLIALALGLDNQKVSELSSTPIRAQDLFESADKDQEELGTIPIVTSNGQTPGTAVVWAIERTDPLVLHAYEATGLGPNLFQGNVGLWGKGGAFIVPTPMEGKVYVGSGQNLVVFGFLKRPPLHSNTPDCIKNRELLKQRIGELDREEQKVQGRNQQLIDLLTEEISGLRLYLKENCGG